MSCCDPTQCRLGRRLMLSSYEAEVLNDIYVCFMYEELVLVETCKGDARTSIIYSRESGWVG